MISGNDWDDIVFGGSRGDIITGGGVDDNLTGNGSRDTINGNDGDDVISGGDGKDTISGGQGDDTISGGGGGDMLSGSSGTDVLTGNSGADTFIFAYDDEMATITDFEDDADILDLSSFGLADVSEATALISEAENNVTFTSGLDILVINNITTIDIADDIII